MDLPPSLSFYSLLPRSRGSLNGERDKHLHANVTAFGEVPTPLFSPLSLSRPIRDRSHSFVLVSAITLATKADGSLNKATIGMVACVYVEEESCITPRVFINLFVSLLYLSPRLTRNVSNPAGLILSLFRSPFLSFSVSPLPPHNSLD